MDLQILHSIIELTRQRDLDALEYSLVATVAELLPVSSISLRRTPQDCQHTDELEEILRIEVRKVANGKPEFACRQEQAMVPLDREVKDCIEHRQTRVCRQHQGLSRAVLPIYAESKFMGVLEVVGHEDLTASTELLEALVKIYSNHLIIIHESERDKLTGLLNRRTFEKKLLRLLSVQRENKALSQRTGGSKERRSYSSSSQAWLAMLDIDHFKHINDTYGHLYGDEVILMLSQKMKQVFREGDLLFRFGGEEFLVVLEPVPMEDAHHALERFRKAMADHVFPQIGKVTVSIGFAGITANDFPQTIVEYADKALYFAKDHGRNCCYNYETLVAEGKLEAAQESGSIDLF